MKHLKTIKLWSMLLLTAVLAAGATATAYSQTGLSADRSPVQTSAEALLAELEAPVTCDPADTLCFAEVERARLKAAKAGIRSLIRIDKERDGIVSTQAQHLALKQKIIDDYAKIDTNSQRIDRNQEENARVYREQIADDKLRIGDLQHRLDSAQSNQKWIAGASALAGGFIGFKLCGATQNLNLQNPFGSQFAGLNFAQSYPLSFYDQTNTEQKLRKLLASKR